MRHQWHVYFHFPSIWLYISRKSHYRSPLSYSSFVRPPLIFFQFSTCTASPRHQKKKSTILFENFSKANKLAKTHYENFEKANESLCHDFSGEVNSFVHQYSRVSIPYNSMRPNVSVSIRKWLEELLCSSKNIEVLADSSLGVIGKGDEDLRMRDMALVGASLEGYKQITTAAMAQRNLYNVSYEFLPLALYFPFSQTILFFFGSSFGFIIKRCCTFFSLYPLLPPSPSSTRNGSDGT